MDAPLKLDPVKIESLRNDLQSAGWDVASLTRLLSPLALAALDREQCGPARVELREAEEPAALLTRLFLLGESVPPDRAALAFPSLTLAGATELGLLTVSQDAVRALVDLRPHASDVGQWWVASDLSEAQTGRPLQPNHVLGIGQATLSLLRMTIREPVGRALDLGTGCGIQALYLATHAQQVLATDLSARACNFASFNLALAQITNVEVRQGSLFDPVVGESFDQITSNPPFVITPTSLRGEGVMEYRDGGMQRDNLIEAVLTQAPSYLNPEGTLQMLANWEIRQGPWQTRPEQWLDQIAVPISAWVVQRDELDPAQYAEMWLRDSGGDLGGRQRWEADYQAWIADFDEAGVRAIGMGMVALQRHAQGQSRVVLEYLPEGAVPDGATVSAALRHLALPEDWESRRLVRASDVREERHYLPGTSDPEVIRLTQGGGMGAPIRVSTDVAALVGASDGELTIAQIIQALAVLGDKEAAEVRAQVAEELPRILRAGMVDFAVVSVS